RRGTATTKEAKPDERDEQLGPGADRGRPVWRGRPKPASRNCGPHPDDVISANVQNWRKDAMMTLNPTDSPTHGQTPPDLASAADAAAPFRTARGVALDTVHLKDTPRRMAAAFAELLSPPSFDATAFDAEGYDDLVMVSGIPFHSLCAHHVLPFVGTVDVAYMPTNVVLGLSKLAWAVRLCSRRLHVQEQLAQQIADWLVEHADPQVVAVR